MPIILILLGTIPLNKEVQPSVWSKVVVALNELILGLFCMCVLIVSKGWEIVPASNPEPMLAERDDFTDFFL